MIQAVTDLPLSSDMHRCQAWIRFAVSDKSIGQMIDALCHLPSLEASYSSSAFLRDMEKPELLRRLLMSLDVFNINLSVGDLCLMPSSVLLWSDSGSRSRASSKGDVDWADVVAEPTAAARSASLSVHRTAAPASAGATPPSAAAMAAFDAADIPESVTVERVK
jgi:hypothetical protein